MTEQVKTLLIAEDRMSPTFNKVGAEAGKLDKQLSGMGGTFASTERSGLSLAGVLQTGIGVALGGLIVNAAGAAVQVASMGISFNAMKESAQVAFTTILGSGEKATALMAELQKFAAETPFAFEELASATKSLIAFGIEGDKSVETLRRLGDIASGVGAPLNDIAQLYGKARVQGRLFAEDINQLTGRGIPIIQELAKQFGVAESEVRNLVESGKIGFNNLETAFVSLTSTGGKFSGMMEAQSKTFSGMMSTLSDNLNQLAGTLSKPIFDVLVQGLTQVNAILGDPSFANGLMSMGNALSAIPQSEFGQWISGELLPALSAAAAEINTSLQPALTALAPVLAEIGRVVGPIIAAGFRMLGNELVQNTIPNMTRGVTMFLDAIPPMIEFGRVVGGVINQALSTLSAIWSGLTSTIKAGIQWIEETQTAFSNLVDDLMGPVAAGFQWFIDNVLTPFTQALAALKNYISQVIAALANLAAKIAGGLPSLPQLPSLPGLPQLPQLPNPFGFGSPQSFNTPANFTGGNRTQNNNISILLPNVRTERDAVQISTALNQIARGAMLRGAQGLT